MAAEKALTTISVAEHTHITEMHEKLNTRLRESQRNEGAQRGNGIRGQILASVAAEGYDNATQDLSDYVEDRTSYPGFQERAGRYVRHCTDLINAIQTKRNFPGLAALSLSKQQEIHEKVLEHFEELKHNLRHIEKIEREHRLVDLRSTVWVLRAFSVWLWGAFAFALLLEIQAGILTSAFVTASLYLDAASTWFINLIF